MDFAVRTNFKSARSWSEFNALRETQKAWRMTNALGKAGIKVLSATKVLGVTAAVVATGITATRAGMYYYNGGTDASVGIKAGIDIVMTGVGFLGPIGFGISATILFLIQQPEVSVAMEQLNKNAKKNQLHLLSILQISGVRGKWRCCIIIITYIFKLLDYVEFSYRWVCFIRFFRC
ncbi:hypothetical protein ACFE6N_11575 [Pedobacter sp. BG31]|uniref:hypothetical protein n=1 Tax=Pedobacter sp. BG31 TaxID=3349697 RepID=UPI0035F386A4